MPRAFAVALLGLTCSACRGTPPSVDATIVREPTRAAIEHGSASPPVIRPPGPDEACRGALDAAEPDFHREIERFLCGSVGSQRGDTIEIPVAAIDCELAATPSVVLRALLGSRRASTRYLARLTLLRRGELSEAELDAARDETTIVVSQHGCLIGEAPAWQSLLFEASDADPDLMQRMTERWLAADDGVALRWLLTHLGRARWFPEAAITVLAAHPDAELRAAARSVRDARLAHGLRGPFMALGVRAACVGPT